MNTRLSAGLGQTICVILGGWDWREKTWDIITDDLGRYSGYHRPKISDIGDQLNHISSESWEYADYESTSRIFESSLSLLLYEWIIGCFYFAAPWFAITPILSHVEYSHTDTRIGWCFCKYRTTGVKYRDDFITLILIALKYCIYMADCQMSLIVLI